VTEFLALLSALVLGGYGFTWACYNKLDKRVETILNNHLKHVEDCLKTLEEK
jgi:hypothetical protein